MLTYKDGECVSTNSHNSEIKPEHPGGERPSCTGDIIKCQWSVGGATVSRRRSVSSIMTSSCLLKAQDEWTLWWERAEMTEAFYTRSMDVIILHNASYFCDSAELLLTSWVSLNQRSLYRNVMCRHLQLLFTQFILNPPLKVVPQIHCFCCLFVSSCRNMKLHSRCVTSPLKCPLQQKWTVTSQFVSSDWDESRWDSIRRITTLSVCVQLVGTRQEEGFLQSCRRWSITDRHRHISAVLIWTWMILTVWWCHRWRDR